MDYRAGAMTHLIAYHFLLSYTSQIPRCINEVYRQFNPNQYPVVLVNFILRTDAYDLNIDPNKRTVFIHSEHNLIEALKVSNTCHASCDHFFLEPNNYVVHQCTQLACFKLLP